MKKIFEQETSPRPPPPPPSPNETRPYAFVEDTKELRINHLITSVLNCMHSPCIDIILLALYLQIPLLD